MVGRRWPAAGMSHVASNIHVAGRRNAFSQRSLSNVQIARLALLEVNEKMPGRYAATKAVRHGGAQPWAAPWGCQAQSFGKPGLRTSGFAGSGRIGVGCWARRTWVRNKKARARMYIGESSRAEGLDKEQIERFSWWILVDP